jgi:acylpyruvate hydrolase
VVIARRGRLIHRERAIDYVAGYSLFNDAMIRDFPLRMPQWTMGKNFDAIRAFGSARCRAAGGPRVAHLGPLERPSNVGCAYRPAHLQRPRADRNDQCRDESRVGLCDHHRNTRWRWGGAEVTCFHAAGDVFEVEIEGMDVLSNPVRDE